MNQLISTESVKKALPATLTFAIVGAAIGRLVTKKRKGYLTGAAVGAFFGIRTTLLLVSLNKEEPKESASIQIESDEAQA